MKTPYYAAANFFRRFVAADGEHDHVGPPGHLDGLRDLFTVCVGIARGDLVLRPGAADFAGIAGPPHLAEPAPLFESRLGFGEIEIAVGIHQRFSFFLPDAHHLRGFFFQSHP